jgi:DNA-binding transcriptional regulator YiaG
MTGQEIKELRTKLSLTQYDLAMKLGCTVQSVSDWENGRSNPHRMFRKKLDELRLEAMPQEPA